MDYNTDSKVAAYSEAIVDGAELLYELRAAAEVFRESKSPAMVSLYEQSAIQVRKAEKVFNLLRDLPDNAQIPVNDAFYDAVEPVINFAEQKQRDVAKSPERQVPDHGQLRERPKTLTKKNIIGYVLNLIAVLSFVLDCVSSFSPIHLDAAITANIQEIVELEEEQNDLLDRQSEAIEKQNELLQAISDSLDCLVEQADSSADSESSECSSETGCNEKD